MVGTYEALLWPCEWNLGEQRGKRAKGEQTGSLNRVFFTDLRPFSRIRGLFTDLGPFQGFGVFLGIWGLFGDLGPFLGIWGLFQGFAAFSGIRSLFADSQSFWGFAAFSGIRGFFGDSQPFRGFVAFSQIHSLFADSRIHGQGSEGSEQATWQNFRYLIFFSESCPFGGVPWIRGRQGPPPLLGSNFFFIFIQFLG